MRKTLFALMLSLGVFALAMGNAAEPSGGCTGSPLPPETGSGISIHNSGDPTSGTGTLRICNNGAVVPLGGAITVSGNPTAQKGSVDVDGDSQNSSIAPCADGFAHVAADGAGPHLFEGPDGSKADTKPGTTGSQPAQEVSPDTFLTDTVANCAGPLPAAPVAFAVK